MTKNRDFKTPVFLKACELARILPTKRQASRWRRHEGLARSFMNAAIEQLARAAKT